VRGGQNWKEHPARRNRRPERVTLPPAMVVQKPPLPQHPYGEWHPLVVEWWDDLWAGPQAKRYTSAHKHAAYLAAHVLDLFYRKPTERAHQLVDRFFVGLGVGPRDLNRVRWEERDELQGAETSKHGGGRHPASGPRALGGGRRDPRLRLVTEPAS
jgi:hypothetical protein